MPKIKIKVTKTHIKNGTKSSTDSCPIALACAGLKNIEGVSVDSESLSFTRVIQVPIPLTFLRRLESAGIDAVSVGLPACGVFESSTDVAVSLPTKAQRFIERFDESEKVTPFEFSVTI